MAAPIIYDSLDRRNPSPSDNKPVAPDNKTWIIALIIVLGAILLFVISYYVLRSGYAESIRNTEFWVLRCNTSTGTLVDGVRYTAEFCQLKYDEYKSSMFWYRTLPLAYGVVIIALFAAIATLGFNYARSLLYGSAYDAKYDVSKLSKNTHRNIAENGGRAVIVDKEQSLLRNVTTHSPTNSSSSNNTSMGDYSGDNPANNPNLEDAGYLVDDLRNNKGK